MAPTPLPSLASGRPEQHACADVSRANSIPSAAAATSVNATEHQPEVFSFQHQQQQQGRREQQHGALGPALASQAAGAVGSGGQQPAAPNCLPDPLPGCWGDASWLDGLPIPDLFLEGDALSLFPQDAPDGLLSLLPPLPVPDQRQPPSGAEASAVAAAAPRAASAAVPGLGAWPGCQPAAGAGAALWPCPKAAAALDQGASWVGDLAASVREMKAEQPAAPLPLQQQDQPSRSPSQGSGAGQGLASAPSCARAGCAAGGAAAAAAGKPPAERRKRGRPRLYDTSGG